MGVLKTTENTRNMEITNPSGTQNELSLLGHIEQIVELSERSQLSDEFFQKASKHLLFVKNVLNISEVAIVFLAILLDNFDSWNFDLSSFARHLNVRLTSLLQYNNALLELEKSGLIKCRRLRGEELYRVPDKTLKAIVEGRNIEQVDFSKFTNEDFMDYVNNLFVDKNENLLTFEDLAEEINQLLSETNHLDFSKRVQKLKYDMYDLNLFFAFLQFVVNDEEEIVGNFALNKFFNNDFEYRTIINSLKKGTNKLLVDNWIEPTNNDGFQGKFVYKMSRKAYKHFLKELGVEEKIEGADSLISSASLVSKTMFYSTEEQQQINQLTSLLHPDNLQNVQERLKENGMRCGFTGLFYGVPGTGKTETVYQIAKSTGRDILAVNVTDVKSMWVGGSERNIKGIFDHYRTLVKKSEITPILLFNEADSVLGTRIKANHSVDKMENAIQNIILQEMEDLNGIMIATTNLTQNLDSAFERRFLYKIEFKKPGLAARKSIWKVMIPSLNHNQVTALANKYDFSGGQIENIARKYAIENILTGEKPTLEILYKFCDNEQLNSKTGGEKIGFV